MLRRFGNQANAHRTLIGVFAKHMEWQDYCVVPERGRSNEAELGELPWVMRLRAQPIAGRRLCDCDEWHTARKRIPRPALQPLPGTGETLGPAARNAYRPAKTHRPEQESSGPARKAALCALASRETGE